MTSTSPTNPPPPPTNPPPPPTNPPPPPTNTHPHPTPRVQGGALVAARGNPRWCKELNQYVGEMQNIFYRDSENKNYKNAYYAIIVRYNGVDGVFYTNNGPPTRKINKLLVHIRNLGYRGDHYLFLEIDPKTNRYSLFNIDYCDDKILIDSLFAIVKEFMVANKKPQRKKTFLISGATGLDLNEFRKILIKKGYTEVSIHDKPQFVDLLYIVQTHYPKLDNWAFDKRTYTIKADTKSLFVNTKCITDKEQLYNLMDPTIRKESMAETWNAKEAKNNRFPIILRPIGSGGGSDIHVVTNEKEYIAAMNKIPKHYKSVIASTYIDNPGTWQKRKMHFRMYMYVGIGPNYFYHKLWHKGKIMTAKKEYTRSNYSDKDIHDTHLKSTPRNLFYPDDLDNPSDDSIFFPQMQKICDAIVDVLITCAKAYEESVFAFQVFGIDFLPTDDGNIVLLEVNNNVGYDEVSPPKGYTPEKGPFSKVYTQFSKEYFTWVGDFV